MARSTPAGLQMVLLHDKGLSHSMGPSMTFNIATFPNPAKWQKQSDDHITKLGLVIITVMWHSDRNDARVGAAARSAGHYTSGAP